MRFIIKICRSTKCSKVFTTATLKFENSMRSSGVPDHLFLYKRVIGIQDHVNLRTASQT